MSILRQNLAFLMDTHQLSANALAQASGAAQPTISRILNGESADPRVQSIQPIADYFQVSVEDLRGKLIKGASTTQVLGNLKVAADAIETGTSKRRRSQALDLMLMGRLPVAIEDAISAALPQELHRNLASATPLAADAFSFDYQSSKVVAEFKASYFRVKNGTHQHQPISGNNVEGSLWRLSACRLQAQAEFPNRRYFLFYLFIDIDTSKVANYVTLPPSFQRVAGEAAAHGIAVMQTTPETAAAIISEAEALS